MNEYPPHLTNTSNHPLLTHLEQTLGRRLHFVEGNGIRSAGGRRVGVGVAAVTSQALHRFPQPDLGVVVVLHFKELLTQLEAILPAHVRAKNKD